ncbi:MAG: hemolysin III family protein [Balneola sp.]|nr:hemolysin III family protein [Balneola sp.]MBO6649864.1 hemolysin III family protein [Balneola sp.]MBO6712428.1 hemolysin III family protein [Balneola sp.]MBO6801421.1 hemolysin III family protein [Balneola sp.]MBO6871765.1 hemolysin III family protein [Balneola sp.]
MSKFIFPVREPFNTYSHLIGAIGALVLLIYLIVNSSEDPGASRISFIVYGITVFLMFASSSIYHAVNVSLETEDRFRLIDHIMIYLVIAGTYTPICTIVLEGNWRLWMLIGIWSFALIGIIKKVFWMSAPRWFSTVLYLLMGWVSVIIFPKLWDQLPHMFSYWIAIGGFFYTIGAIIYGTKKPDPFPKVFGFHEIWHLFVLGGAFSHFYGIYKFLPGYIISG